MFFWKRWLLNIVRITRACGREPYFTHRWCTRLPVYTLNSADRQGKCKTIIVKHHLQKASLISWLSSVVPTLYTARACRCLLRRGQCAQCNRLARSLSPLKIWWVVLTGGGGGEGWGGEISISRTAATALWKFSPPTCLAGWAVGNVQVTPKLTSCSNRMAFLTVLPSLGFARIWCHLGTVSRSGQVRPALTIEINAEPTLSVCICVCVRACTRTARLSQICRLKSCGCDAIIPKQVQLLS